MLREELDRLAGRINADYADLDWMPIRYLARSYSRGALSGLFRLARVGLVTPLYDGMNLVAKEYVAAQDPEDPGALVLSEFAGAADELRQAWLVNPYDINGMKSALLQACTADEKDLTKRMRAMRRTVRSNDVAAWADSFMTQLASVGEHHTTRVRPDDGGR